MSLADIPSQSKFLRVPKGERRRVRLLLVPGHPKYGDVVEGWFHVITENPVLGQTRGKFLGYERCISKSKNDMTCPLCRDRSRFSMVRRRACNVWCYEDNKILILNQGPQIWDQQIIPSLQLNVDTVNQSMEQSGQPFTPYNVFTITQILDFYITRNANDSYTVQSMVNNTPVGVTEADLIDITALEEYIPKSPEELTQIMSNILNAQPTQTPMQSQAGLGGGLSGGMGVPPNIPTTPPTFVPPTMTPPVFTPPTMTPSPIGVGGTIPTPPMTTVQNSPPNIDMSTMVMPGMPNATPYMSIDDARSIAVPMGKYKGKTLGEVADTDPQYLKYITSTKELEEGPIKDAARMLIPYIVDGPVQPTNPNEQVMADISGGVALKQATLKQAIDSGKYQYSQIATAIIGAAGSAVPVESLTEEQCDAALQALGAA